jgi:hypothetical protein
MSNGSGLFTTQQARVPHLAKVTGEIGDLRRDVAEELLPMAAFTVDEWADPVAADTNGILLSVPSATGDVSYVAADLVGGAAVEMDPPRNVTVTTGGTAANGFTDLEVVGKDINGADMTEDIASINSAATHAGVKAFAEVTGLNFTGGTDATATHEVGWGDVIGLNKPIKSRAGLATVLMEIEAGSKVTTGTIVDAATGEPNGTYEPNTVPDAANDYAVYYEYDPTA